jgi:hypothetical protein
VKTRTIAAFLIAPISFGLLLLLIWSSSGTMGLVGLVMSALIGYSLALLIGLPVYFLMQKTGANGLVSYGFMAIVFAAILIFYLIGLPVHHENDGDLSSLASLERIRQMAVLAFGSFFTVLVFWLIARPDKADKESESS